MSIVKYYQKLNISPQRRALLLEDMFKLHEQGIDCNNCDGRCCDFSNNSMQIDYLQGLEILYFLEQQQLDFVAEIQRVLDEYRLGYELTVGKSKSLRRNYRCPFYRPGPKGCTIAWEWRPYGCLAFNRDQRGECRSNLVLLQQREELFGQQESSLNQQIKKELNLWRDKAPIPVILLELRTRLCSSSCQVKGL